MTERNSDLEYRNYGEGQDNWTTGRTMGRVGEGDNGTDERIREDICDRLMQLGPVDCTAVDVSVAAGVVTLGGTLPTADFRQRVLDVVTSIAGVQSVNDKLKVS
jgi:osmotically-inducible protein OsmY